MLLLKKKQKKKQTKWGGCDNIVIAWHCHSLVACLRQSLVRNKGVDVKPPSWIRVCLSLSFPNKNLVYNLLHISVLCKRYFGSAETNSYFRTPITTASKSWMTTLWTFGHFTWDATNKIVVFDSELITGRLGTTWMGRSTVVLSNKNI